MKQKVIFFFIIKCRTNRYIHNITTIKFKPQTMKLTLLLFILDMLFFKLSLSFHMFSSWNKFKFEDIH